MGKASTAARRQPASGKPRRPQSRSEVQGGPLPEVPCRIPGQALHTRAKTRCASMRRRLSGSAGRATHSPSRGPCKPGRSLRRSDGLGAGIDVDGIVLSAGRRRRRCRTRSRSLFRRTGRAPHRGVACLEKRACEAAAREPPLRLGAVRSNHEKIQVLGQDFQ